MIFSVENMNLIAKITNINCESKQVIYHWKEECLSFIQKQANAVYAHNINEVDGKN